MSSWCEVGISPSFFANRYGRGGIALRAAILVFRFFSLLLTSFRTVTTSGLSANRLRNTTIVEGGRGGLLNNVELRSEMSSD
jgi:hypothetical protein